MFFVVAPCKMRRLATAANRRVAVAAAVPLVGQRTFFGKGWDNAALDTVYKHLMRKPEIQEVMRNHIAARSDPRMLQVMAEKAKIAADNNSAFRIFMPAHLGDPHRLLKAYSLTAYPILDEMGQQMLIDVDGHNLPAYADPDDDYSKVCLPHLEITELLACELLKLLDWEATPRGAASLLESLYRGAEIPDHVFQTPAVIERQW